ncbi:hypothetical protein BH11BAC3_BH11BAC3_35710 [soil metagenome]
MPTLVALNLQFPNPLITSKFAPETLIKQIDESTGVYKKIAWSFISTHSFFTLVNKL